VVFLVTSTKATYRCRRILRTVTRLRTPVREDIASSTINRLPVPPTAAGLDNDQRANVIIIV